MHNKREIVFKKGTRVYCSKCGAYQLELAKNVRAKEYSEASKAMKEAKEQEKTCKCGGIFFKNEEGGMQLFTANGWAPRKNSAELDRKNLDIGKEVLYLRRGEKIPAKIHHFGNNRVCIRFFEKDSTKERFYWVHPNRLTET